MLFDLFGDFALEDDRQGMMPLSSIVELGARLGLSSVAVRAAASRVLHDGWLESQRRGRETIYKLSSRGIELVAEGRTRIFAQPDETWDGMWHLIAVSVPEARRDIRDRIRKELTWLGFGSPSNALYICPRNRLAAVSRLADDLQATEYLQMYSGVAIQPADPHELVARSWGDLGLVNQSYADFVDTFQPLLARTRSDLANESFVVDDAFRLRFALVNRFRKCLFGDPGLPLELLPSSWRGSTARRVFLEFHALVTPAALSYFDAVCRRDAVPAVARPITRDFKSGMRSPGYSSYHLEGRHRG
jgi:phenylacetic acid degradation operon negative regulatory protein